MQKPDLPHDEDKRLKALHGLQILDTAPDERFDRLTRMARRLFQVPIALVSLVDENRQWFKSCYGLEVRETPREVSFCGHAILDDKILIIPDARADVRFADNPLVVDKPNIGFYAGCPLRSTNGSRIGTLCIIDVKPRSLGRDDLESLQDLAAMVERELVAVELAIVDELTKISNRRGFLALAEHGLSLCARQNLPACLVFLDLNKFKSINDRYGHAEGDQALIAFADLMKGVFRSSDIFARLGGDEFVALLTNTVASQADEIIVRLSDALRDFNRAAARGYDLAFAHGVVEYSPSEPPAIEKLLSEGDALMYENKKRH